MSRRHKGYQTTQMTPAASVAAIQRDCGNCRHWHRLTASYGQCRRYPPCIASTRLEKEGPYGVFPLVSLDDFCGEHEPLLSSSDPIQ